MRAQTVWFFFLVVTGFSLSIELIFELFRQILSKQEIEAEKNKAELALYKAQINPHFLFNTLKPSTDWYLRSRTKQNPPLSSFPIS